MKKIIFVLIILVFVFQFCKNNSQNHVENERLNSGIEDLFNQYYEDRLKLYPLEATLAGDNRYNDLLPNNITESYRASLKEFYSTYKNKLLQFNRSELSDENQISYDVLIWECDINLHGLNYLTHLMPINQEESLHLTIGQLAGGISAQPFKTVIDYENWLIRLDAFTVWCDTAIVNMRRGIAKGYVLPKALTKKVVLQMAELNHGPIQEHLFYSPIKLIPEKFTDEDKTRLKKNIQKL